VGGEGSWIPALAPAIAGVGALVAADRSWRRARWERRAHGLTQSNLAERRPPPGILRSPRARRISASMAIACPAALISWVLAGPAGLVVAGLAAVAVPRIMARRKERGRAELMERELGQLSETACLALRSGLSVGQSLEFARRELSGPLGEALERFLEERRLGIPFEAALESLGAEVGTDDAHLFCLVMSIHARSGGDVAGALDEVAGTIRHRVAVRRELRAASTQGRISGLILGTLPIAFFLVLAASSHSQLGPVYRSVAGVAMIGTGLSLEGLAYLWIRRLLRIEV